MSITVTDPTSGCKADIQWIGHKYVDGAPIMVPVTQFSVYLSGYAGGGHHYKRLDKAIAEARRTVGDYDCAHCSEAIHWIAEPHRVYVHNHNGVAACDSGITVAETVGA